MKPIGPPNLMDGADCARRGRAVTVNPFDFDTPEHWRWLAEWHEGSAEAHRYGTPARQKFEQLGQMYRRQYEAVRLTSTHGG